MEKQIKSVKRVRDYGEVFTDKREVNAMLDMVKQETLRIDSRFLEPACGNGNFLIEILKRKMDEVTRLYKRIQNDFERYSFIAISSIYGVDLLEDNVLECKKRLFNLFVEYYETIYKKKCKKEFEDIIKYLLEKNILCGDALTMKQSDNKPLVFAEWSMIGSQVKRTNYTFEDLLNNKKRNKIREPQLVGAYPNIYYMEVLKYE